MKRFLLAKDLALGADQSNLSDGQLSIFAELADGRTKVWATGDVVKRFCIMVGAGGGRGIICTPYMEARPRVKILKKATPVAGVKESKKIQFTAKADNTYGSSSTDDFNVQVDIMGGMDNFGNEKQGRTYTVQGMYATATAFNAAIAADINNNTVYRDLQATSDGTGVTITTTDAYKNASIFVSGYHAPSSTLTSPQTTTVTVVTALTLGSGDIAHIKRLDREQQASLGNFYYVDSELPQNAVLNPAANSTFDLSYMYVQDHDKTTELQAHGNEVYAETYVAFPAGTTVNQTAFRAAIEEIMGTTFIESAIS